MHYVVMQDISPRATHVHAFVADSKEKSLDIQGRRSLCGMVVAGEAWTAQDKMPTCHSCKKRIEERRLTKRKVK